MRQNAQSTELPEPLEESGHGALTRAPGASPGSAGRRAHLAVAGLALALVLAFAICKAMLFEGLEYLSDIQIHVQKANSFLFGFPILYDNFHGPQPYHNTFVELLLGPLSARWGAYGLFAPTYALILLTAFALLDLAGKGSAEQRWSHYFLLLACLLGPVGFWMWDNVVYGWHPEILAFPFSVLMTCAILRERPRQAALWGALLLSVHENSPVVICSILLMREILGKPWREIFERRSLLRICGIIAVCLALFGIAMAIQQLWDSAGSSRLSAALARNISYASAAKMLLQALLILFSSSLVVFLSGFRVRDMLLALACCLPLLITGTIASLPYSDNPSEALENIMWSPRYCFLWGAFLSGALIHVSRLRIGYSRERLAVSIALLAIVSLGLQHYALSSIRSYSPWARIGAIRSGQLTINRLSPREVAFMECVAGAVDTRTPLQVSSFLVTMFHRHNVGEYTPANPYAAYPLITICDTLPRSPFVGGCLKLQEAAKGRKEIRRAMIDGLSVTYDREQRGMRSCVKAANAGKAQAA